MPENNIEVNLDANKEDKKIDEAKSQTVHYHLSANVKFDIKNDFNGEEKDHGNNINPNIENNKPKSWKINSVEYLIIVFVAFKISLPKTFITVLLDFLYFSVINTIFSKSFSVSTY